MPARVIGAPSEILPEESVSILVASMARVAVIETNLWISSPHNTDVDRLANVTIASQLATKSLPEGVQHFGQYVFYYLHLTAAWKRADSQAIQ